MAERYRMVLRDVDVDLSEMAVEERERLAKTTKDTNILKKLANDKENYIRSNVASNPNTPSDALRKLAKDEYSWVRRCVASNPNTPVEILRKLAKDDNEYARGAVARNNNTSVDLFRQLANDKDKFVRSCVASNPNTPVEILRKLAKDEAYVSVEAILSNKLSLDEVIEYLKNYLYSKTKGAKSVYPLTETINNFNIPTNLINEAIDTAVNNDKKFIVAELNRLLTNPKISSDYLMKIVKAVDSKNVDAWKVFENKNVTPEIIKWMAENSRNKYNRKYAKREAEKLGIDINKNETLKLVGVDSDFSAPSGYGSTGDSELIYSFELGDLSFDISIHGFTEDFQQYEDWCEAYAKATHKKYENVFEQKCNSETEWDTSYEDIKEQVIETLEEEDIKLSNSDIDNITKKIESRVNKDIKKYWGWNPELIEDMNNIDEDGNYVR